jgi:hypothetical protein
MVAAKVNRERNAMAEVNRFAQHVIPGAPPPPAPEQPAAPMPPVCEEICDEHHPALHDQAHHRLPAGLRAGRLRHGFALRMGQKRMPLARCGSEVWYGAEQVEPKRDPDELPERPIKLVQGGNMAGVRRRR